MHLIIGMVEEKDHAPILEQLIPLADSVTFTRFQSRERNCATPEELNRKSKKFLRTGTRVSMRLHAIKALEKILEKAHRKDVVLVTGSFFLAGELRKYWIPEERILVTRKPF
jgi:dihydrofolate synthase / folylpolyglutamate synthase